MAKAIIFTPTAAANIGEAVRKVLRKGSDLTGQGTGGPQIEDPNVMAFIVKRNGGSDGSATTFASYAYDIYPIGDTGYTNKQNASALQPELSPARFMEGKVTAATDGSRGLVTWDEDGVMVLLVCAEKRTKQACS